MHVAAADSESTLACPRCVLAPGGDATCPRCGRPWPRRDGIVEAIGPLVGTNRIAAAFYDGPGWVKFRPWERLFLRSQGGAKARRQILRHLPEVAEARVLEVGIGDGENLPLLPGGWDVSGVDIARTQLAACRDRFPAMAGRLAWAEGEALPFDDGAFDAAFSIGGFNYFRDQAAALRELRRVTRAGGVMIVADEIPDLHTYALGHRLGLPQFTAWCLRATGLDREFVEMVLGHRADADEAAHREWPGHRRFRIWNRLGYCLVGQS